VPQSRRNAAVMPIWDAHDEAKDARAVGRFAASVAVGVELT
jgi:hypothetical protein